MNSFEEAFAASVTGPDERAAGVISGSDPYRELELYLEKVHDEIGEVFDKWSYLSEASRASAKSSCRQETDGRTHCAIRPDKFLANNNDTSFIKSCSLPSRRNSSRCETYLDAWSKSLLAEFGTVLQSGKSADAIENAEDDYDEVAADSSDDDSMRMKYHISQRDDFEISSSSSPTVSPSTSEHSSSGSSGTRRTPPYLSRIGRGKQRSHVASIHNKRDPVLVNVKIYPTERLRVPETRKADYEFENSQRSYMPVKCCTGQNYSKSRLAVTDTGTQTSPAESRSSSFTWMSDCSEDDHSSTASSTEDSRRLGDSSGDLTPVKDEPESGIGTASFPRHNKYNKSSNAQKNDRKEQWEKLRRRPKEKSGSASRKSPASHSDVDRHKNCAPVESSSDPDLAVFRIPRPSRLPLASSSLSPESSRETLPSPSATSLTLGLEPCDLMVREFAGKSSSAPLLLKQPLYSSTQKVSKHSKFHSEKLLIGSNSAVSTSVTGTSSIQLYTHSMVEQKSAMSRFFLKYVSRVSSSTSGIAEYDTDDEHRTEASLEKDILNDLTDEPLAKAFRSVVFPERRSFFRNDGKTMFRPVISDTYFAGDENVASNRQTGVEAPYWDNQIESSMSDSNPFLGDSINAENEMNLGRGSLLTTDVTNVPIDTLLGKSIESPSILHNIIIPEPKIFFKSKLTGLMSMRSVNDKYNSTTSVNSDKTRPVDPLTTTIIEDASSKSNSPLLQLYGHITTNAITDADLPTQSTRSKDLKSATQSAKLKDLESLTLSTYLRTTPKPGEDIVTRLQPSKNFKSSESIPSIETKNTKAVPRTTKIVTKDPFTRIEKPQQIDFSTQPVTEKSVLVSLDKFQTDLRSDLTTRSMQSTNAKVFIERVEELPPSTEYDLSNNTTKKEIEKPQIYVMAEAPQVPERTTKRFNFTSVHIRDSDEIGLGPPIMFLGASFVYVFFKLCGIPNIFLE